MRRSLKNIVTLTLATAMVLGSTMTAFAEPATGTTGTGSSTGHVDTEVLNVVYPTIPSETTPFSYIMDSERLIRKTEKYKNTAVTLSPGEDDDTGVYFTTADNTYNNTSTALDVINKSSVDVDVTAKVIASVGDNETMVDLADSSEVSSSDLELYLGLKVGDDEVAVTDAEAGVTAKATVAGYAANFEYVSNNNGTYSYQVRTTSSDPALDDTKWAKTTISMTGAVSAVDNTDEVTAPTLTVTWTAAKAATTTEAYLTFAEGAFWVAKDSEPTAFTDLTVAKISAFTINNVNVKSAATVDDGYAKVTWTNAAAKGLAEAANKTYVANITIDGTSYTATYVSE